MDSSAAVGWSVNGQLEVHLEGPLHLLPDTLSILGLMGFHGTSFSSSGSSSSSTSCVMGFFPKGEPDNEGGGGEGRPLLRTTLTHFGILDRLNPRQNAGKI